jgi:dihydroorotate dehydrogenase (NAD+) catalytic subunit
MRIMDGPPGARTGAAPLLAVDVAGIRCANPVWAASGCAGYGRELAAAWPLSALGALCVKGTSLEPWRGNPGPRVAETACGMLNAIGLQNPGVDHLLTRDLPWLVRQGTAVVVNIVGRTIEEYAAVARRLGDAPAGAVAGVELNISCPNVREGGLQFGADLGAAAEVTAAVREATSLPLLVKLSPNVTDVAAFAAAVERAGADGVSLINTLLGMRIDVAARRPILANLTGGLSGPACKPVALRMVWEVAGSVSIPVVGIGGIATGLDAAEFLLAGASAVQVGTAIFRDPWAPVRVRDELEAWLRAQGMASAREAVGAGRP